MCGKAQPDGRPDSIETRLQISPFVDWPKTYLQIQYALYQQVSVILKLL